MTTIIRIGTSARRLDYYGGDDVPPVSKSKAIRFATREQAESEADLIRETWNLKPSRGATTKVVCVTE